MARRVGRGIALLFYSMTAALEQGKGSASRFGRSLPPGKTRYPLYSRLGRPQGRSGRAENLAPTGIRSLDLPARSQSLCPIHYNRLFELWPEFDNFWLTLHTRKTKSAFVRLREVPKQSSFRAAILG